MYVKVWQLYIVKFLKGSVESIAILTSSSSNVAWPLSIFAPIPESYDE